MNERDAPSSFLGAAEITPETQVMYDGDIKDLGYVMNASQVWAHQTPVHDALFELMRDALPRRLADMRTRGILVVASAAARGDSYCSLAWGSRLANATDPDTASSVVVGKDDGLTDSERLLATWARAIAIDPNSTTEADVQGLRDAGYSDAEIVGMTVYISLRIAFSTVNDALGARPDAAYRSSAPKAVLDAVTFGRPIAAGD